MSNDTPTSIQQMGGSYVAPTSRITSGPAFPAFCPGAGIAEAIKLTGLAFVLAASTCTLATDPWANVQADNSTHLSATQEKPRKRSLREAREHALKVLFQAERERSELAMQDAQASAVWEDNVL